jgi:fatty acid amide hydrolase 2
MVYDKAMNRLLLESGTGLAGMIRRGETTSEEVVRTHIERAAAVNPSLNAIVRDRFSEAIEEARSADALLKRAAPEDLPPFHGVPCTIKECFPLAGMPNCAGHVARKDFISRNDATAVIRLRKAGAIPLGVTNTSELCMWMESFNRVYGRTRNPYDTSRIVGGSSGGEGAVIGAGASPFGLGSDIGGSIRMPAFFNGVFGHKPSSCLVPNTGQYPDSHGEAQKYLCTGPLSRRAADLMPLLRILAGPDGVSPCCGPVELGDPASVEIRGMNVLVVEENGEIPVSRALRDAMRRAAKALEDRGAAVRPASFPMLKNSLRIWSSMLSLAGGPSYEDLLGGGGGISLALEAARLAAGKSPYTLPSLGLVAMERMLEPLKGGMAKWKKACSGLQDELTRAMGPDGVMLYPPYSRTAPGHKVPLALTFHFQYTAIMNVLEFPVTQVPLGLDSSGLPLGVQVAGCHGRDHVTIAAAVELEKAFGGWVPPPPLALI